MEDSTTLTQLYTQYTLSFAEKTDKSVYVLQQFISVYTTFFILLCILTGAGKEWVLLIKSMPSGKGGFASMSQKIFMPRSFKFKVMCPLKNNFVFVCFWTF